MLAQPSLWAGAQRLRGAFSQDLSYSLGGHLCEHAAGHNYIGTEHILLGLLREGEGVAARVLETLGADPSKIRTQVIPLRNETAATSQHYLCSALLSASS